MHFNPAPTPLSAGNMPRRGLRILKVAALYTLALLINLLLLQLVIWKEDSMFWRNAGGYPVGLRNMVEIIFYPLLTLQFYLLIIASVLQARATSDQGPARGTFLTALVLLWLLFAGVPTVLMWNNIDNLLNSRPLHYHQPVP